MHLIFFLISDEEIFNVAADATDVTDAANDAEPSAEEEEEEEDWNLFKLLRSYSLPNISNTPLESLFATISSEITQPRQSENEPDDVHPVVTFEDEDSEDQGPMLNLFCL
jgi:hypothetical protein